MPQACRDRDARKRRTASKRLDIQGAYLVWQNDLLQAYAVFETSPAYAPQSRGGLDLCQVLATRKSLCIKGPDTASKRDGFQQGLARKGARPYGIGPIGDSDMCVCPLVFAEREQEIAHETAFLVKQPALKFANNAGAANTAPANATVCKP